MTPAGNDIPAVIAILVGALGERVGSLFTALAAMAMWFCGLSAVTWSSRTIYAFARDNGMPGSVLWRRVSAKYRTPAARRVALGPGGYRGDHSAAAHMRS